MNDAMHPWELGNHSIGTSVLPRRLGGSILYLDYDGVLHPESVYQKHGKAPYVHNAPGHRLFEHAPALVELLQPYPDVKIVLSTTWSRLRGMSRAAKSLPLALRSRVVGATYHSQMDAWWFSQLPRGKQVLLDVCRRRPSSWLALDDDRDGWGAFNDHVVWTDPMDGIAHPAVLADLTRRLDQCFGLTASLDAEPGAS
jgi:hypothetical protein